MEETRIYRQQLRGTTENVDQGHAGGLPDPELDESYEKTRTLHIQNNLLEKQGNMKVFAGWVVIVLVAIAALSSMVFMWVHPDKIEVTATQFILPALYLVANIAYNEYRHKKNKKNDPRQ